GADAPRRPGRRRDRVGAAGQSHRRAAVPARRVRADRHAPGVHAGQAVTEAYGRCPYYFGRESRRTCSHATPAPAVLSHSGCGPRRDCTAPLTTFHSSCFCDSGAPRTNAARWTYVGAGASPRGTTSIASLPRLGNATTDRSFPG